MYRPVTRRKRLPTPSLRLAVKGVFLDEMAGDVDHLLPVYERLLAQIAETRGKPKAQLREALAKSRKDEC